MTNLPPTIALSLLLAVNLQAADTLCLTLKPDFDSKGALIVRQMDLTGWCNRRPFLKVKDESGRWYVCAQLETNSNVFVINGYHGGAWVSPELESTIAIRLTLITNWTGVTFKDRELGYIATNHVAEVVYLGETNHFTLRTDASEVATWRTNYPRMTFSNIIPGPLLIGTNIWGFDGVSQ